ncbi:MAG: hypothetical protein ACP5KG_11575, partial [Myxococcota bacterium]
ECLNKTCRIKTCYFPYGDCDNIYQNGCETPLTTVDRCGDCNNDCTQLGWAHVQEYKCDSGFYRYFCNISMCEVNWANCDDILNTGCEANLTTDKNNCGSCGKFCDENKMHVNSAFCSNGNCDYDYCKISWEDQNFSRSDGCESYNYFPKTYGTNSGEEATSIIPVDDGYLIVGNSNNSILIIRVDLNGNIRWSKLYNNDVSPGYSFFANSAILEPGPNITPPSYIIAGSVKYPSGDNDLIVFKINDNGDVKWTFIYTSQDNDVATSILKISDGYLVLGRNISYIGSNINALVIKLDSNGKSKWGYIYDMDSQSGDIASENIFSAIDYGSGYLITGSTEINKNSDVLLMGIEYNGDFDNAIRIGTANQEYGKAINSISDGYIISGFLLDANRKEDVIFMKLDKSLNSVSGYTYGNSNSNLLINMTKLTDNSGFVLAGQTATDINSYDAFLMKVDNYGTIIWQKGYGGSNWDMFNNVAYTPFDSGYIALGKSISFTSSYDLWAVKTDSNGGVSGTCPPAIPYTLNFYSAKFYPQIISYKMKTKGITFVPGVLNITASDVKLDSNMQCSAP